MERDSLVLSHEVFKRADWILGQEKIGGVTRK